MPRGEELPNDGGNLRMQGSLHGDRSAAHDPEYSPVNRPCGVDIDAGKNRRPLGGKRFVNLVHVRAIHAKIQYISQGDPSAGQCVLAWWIVKSTRSGPGPTSQSRPVDLDEAMAPKTKGVIFVTG